MEQGLDGMWTVNTTKNKVLAKQTRVAATFGKRLVGLLLKPDLPKGEALVLTPCQGVHTCGMRFNIDVVFLDDNQRVVHVLPNLPPWSSSPVVPQARLAIELPAGTIEETRTDLGDVVGFYRER